MELHGPKLSDRGVFPAIELTRSGAEGRAALAKKELVQDWSEEGPQPDVPVEAMELLIDRMGKTKSNEEFSTRLTDSSRRRRAGASLPDPLEGRLGQNVQRFEAQHEGLDHDDRTAETGQRSTGCMSPGPGSSAAETAMSPPGRRTGGIEWG